MTDLDVAIISESPPPQPTPSTYAYPLLLKQLLHTAMRQASDQEIVYRDLVRYTYRELSQRIARLANALEGLGVRPGQTVAVLDWDSHRYLESYFAVPGIGAVLHMVNIRLSPEQILYTINHAQDDVLLVHRDFLPVLEEIWPRIERDPTVVLLRDEDGDAATSLALAGEYEQLLAGSSARYTFPDFDENTRATTFYTTGTTGLPKGVSFSHRQLVLHTLALAAALGTGAVQGRLHRGDVYMPITPMFHVHAWGMPFVATMLGLKQVYPGRYAPDTLLALVAGERVSFSHGVPTLLHMLLTSPAAAEVDLSGWKVMIGGSALPRGLAGLALERGMDVFAGYGMSETCPMLTVSQLPPAMLASNAEEQLEYRARAGLAIPLVDLQIVDERMDTQPANGRSSGEIVVRAPWLTPRYLRDPKSSEALWRGGWLHTNDIGVLHPDGCLQITDRLKDVIKTGGEWVSSLEVEDLISQVPGVGEVAVIGLPDPKWGERPLAIVVRGPGNDSVDEAAIKAHLQGFAESGVISKYAIPSRIEFAGALAKTSVGKLDKKALRQRYSPDSSAR